MSYTRFAIYYVPPTGSLATFGASWLGWDTELGRRTVQFDIPGLDNITATPRKYGFHGTLKPPFRLAVGQSLARLKKATARVAQGLAPAVADSLELSVIGRFLGLTPTGDLSGLQHLAASVVRELDHFRAPPTDGELSLRRAAGLTERQDALLVQWGYPYVLDAFRFHLTLTGKLPADELSNWHSEAERLLPDMPAPFVLDQIALCGERHDGRFEVLHRYTLCG